MKLSLFCFLPLLYFGVASASTCVGTTLFVPADYMKTCWTENERALLQARILMQDLLPKAGSLNFNDPRIVVALLEYFHSCFEIIRRSTTGRSQHVMLLSLADAVGGYLQSYILPLSRRAYYAGKVRYLDLSELHNMFQDIKLFLKTSGVGWATSQGSYGVVFQVEQLDLTTTGGSQACEALDLTDGPMPLPSKEDLPFNPKTQQKFLDPFQSGSIASNQNMNQYSEGIQTNEASSELRDELQGRADNDGNSEWPILTRVKRGEERAKRGLQEELNGNNAKQQLKEEQKMSRTKREDGTIEETIEEMDAGRSVGVPYNADKSYIQRGTRSFSIPLPILDDGRPPHSIAVPFKDTPLRSLHSKKSVYVLVRYYVAAVKCICSRANSEQALTDFNSNFYAWTATHIFPLLSSEEWYPAFGGVLRIIEYIKHQGGVKMSRDHDTGKPAFLFRTGFTMMERDKHQTDRNSRNETEMIPDDETLRKEVMGTAAAIFNLVWVGVFLFYWWKRKKLPKKEDKEDEENGEDAPRQKPKRFRSFLKEKRREDSYQSGRKVSSSGENTWNNSRRETRSTQKSPESSQERVELAYTAHVGTQHHEPFTYRRARMDMMTSQGSTASQRVAKAGGYERGSGFQKSRSVSRSGGADSRLGTTSGSENSRRKQKFSYSAVCHDAGTNATGRPSSKDSDSEETNSESET